MVVYRRAGCHLCDVAAPVVARACAATGTTWREVDVDAGDPDDPDGAAASAAALRARYGDLVPVVEVDGRHHGHWRIDEAALVAALRG